MTKLKIIFFIYSLILFPSMLSADSTPAPYTFNIFFYASSSTPEIDYILKLKKILKAIKEKNPVQIEILGFAAPDEDRTLSEQRAEYVKRWLKSKNINAAFVIHQVENRKSSYSFMREEKKKELRKVEIRVYDQRAIYAIQDKRKAEKQKNLKKPVARTSSETYSFGTVLEGSIINCKFYIRNIGNKALDILKVKPDCGCTSVSYPKKILPGEIGTFEIDVETDEFGDKRIKKKILITTTDPDNKNISFFITGMVEKFADISPGRIMLAGKSNKEIKKTITIRPRKHYPFEITDIKAKSGKNILCRLKATKTGKPPEYEIIVKNLLRKKGRYKDSIIIHTTNKTRPEIIIDVSGRIREPKKKRGK